jgi:hypothetical protein
MYYNEAALQEYGFMKQTKKRNDVELKDIKAFPIDYWRKINLKEVEMAFKVSGMKCFVLKDAHSLWYWKEKEIENC